MTWRRAQSHSEQVRRKAHVCTSYGDLTDSGISARYMRRALLRGAVFENHDAGLELLAQRPTTAATVVTGVLTEVTPQAIVVKGATGGDQFLALSPGTVSWLGAPVSTSALRA